MNFLGISGPGARSFLPDNGKSYISTFMFFTVQVAINSNVRDSLSFSINQTFYNKC